MTAGELADLRSRIGQLEAENSSLREKLGEKQSLRKVRSTIEIGMTRAELMTFVRRDSNLKIIGQSADAGVRVSEEETIVTRESTGNKDLTVQRDATQSSTAAPVETDDHSRVRTRSKDAEESQSKTKVETLRSRGQQETIRIGRYAT